MKAVSSVPPASPPASPPGAVESRVTPAPAERTTPAPPDSRAILPASDSRATPVPTESRSSGGPTESRPKRDLGQRALYLDSVRAERRALGAFSLVALAAIMWVVRPIGGGILLGMLFAFSLQPFYDRIALKNRRPALTALGFVAVSTIALLVTLVSVSSLFIARGAVLATALITALAPRGAIRTWAEQSSQRIGGLPLSPDDISARLHDAVVDVASRAAGIAAMVASTTFEVLLGLFFAMMTMAFVLRHWEGLALRAEDMMPLRPRYTRAILTEFKQVGRTTLLGSVVTGIAQGALAGIGYFFTGVPEAAFFGVATAFASLLPGVGTLLVWVPAGVFLLATGHPAMGVTLLVWGGIVVVGVSDYIIRPRLVGGDSDMPALFTFAALFGGVEVFGLSGLLLGPLIMSVSLAILRIFAREAAEQRARGERHVALDGRP